jgi:hypothetical protein
MFNLRWGPMSRRGFLQVGALGSALTLADMLRLRGPARGSAAPRAKSVIQVFLYGGPPHQDTYDLKPDAPKEIRGPFQPIQTNVTGVQVCELLPLQARMWDKLAVIRSVVGMNGGHGPTPLMTGFSEAVNRTLRRPCLGAVVSKMRGSTGGVPPFINVRSPNEYIDEYKNPGYLGMEHAPFTVHERPPLPGFNRAPDLGVQNMHLRKTLTVERLQDRQALLRSFDGLRRDLDATGSMAAVDEMAGRAFDLVTSGKVGEALDLTKVDAKTRARYQHTESYLLARRLVEAGVGCVSFAPEDVGLVGRTGDWDLHVDCFGNLKRKLPLLDRGISNLVQDLHDRGLDQDVVVLVWGEMGRTPIINKDGGRDHWGNVMAALVAGGGLKMGQVIGATTARAEEARDRPYRTSQVMSTIYHAIGIDPGRTFTVNGRPIHILDDREPVKELL